MWEFLRRFLGTKGTGAPPAPAPDSALAGQKRPEAGTRESDERLRLMVEGVKDYAIFMLDPEGYVVTWNAGAERLKGYTAQEIIGQHFSRFYPEEAIDRGWPNEELRRAIADGRIEDEGWRLRKDGTKFWASVIITALRDATGVLRGFGKVTRDLTERRQAEENVRRLIQEEAARKAAEASAEELDRQREQLQVTLSSIGDAVVVTDHRGRVTFLNAVAMDLCGWRNEEAAGLPLEKIFHIINEQTRRPVENPIEVVLRENRVVELANHTALVGRDGREVPVEDSAAPIRTRSGSIAGAVLVFRDVTEVRRATEARLYLASIVEFSDDAIIGQTLEGRIASWNRGAERLYGYTSQEAIGQSLTLLIPPDHRDELPAIIERIRRSEFIEHFETQRVRKDGVRVDVSLTISPVRNSEGEIIGASKIARDITARKEEDRRKGEFLALLAHELRNPLAPLGNGLQVLRQSGDRPEVVERVRPMMERQLHHLVRLVDDLLDVSRISRGKLELRREPLALGAAVQHALDVFGQPIRDHNHELRVSIPEEPIVIEADRTRLTQMISNLLSNADKYSPPGRPISLTIERQDNEAVIRVKDEGMGISPEFLPHVFEMFTQGDLSLEKAQGGLGVGLTVVKRLIEMHGGSVEAKSAGAGKGSEFILRFPLAFAEAPAPPPSRTAPPATTVPRRILVVDDNVDSADSLAMLLKMVGHDVHTANNGFAGLETASVLQPDLILLDIGMPGLNGYEVARRIREEPWGKTITLAALTGWGQRDDRLRSREAGFDLHMVKPVEPAELERLLAGLPQPVG